MVNNFQVNESRTRAANLIFDFFMWTQILNIEIILIISNKCLVEKKISKPLIQYFFK